MREIRALIRVSWQMALSYRVSVVLSLVALLFSVVPIYYVARALQPELAPHIANQGGEYFAFLLVGLIGLWFISAAVNLVPHIFSSGIANGTLEALLATRTSLPQLLAGLIGYGFIWTGARSLLLLAAGIALGIHIAWGSALLSLVVLALLTLAYLAFGLMMAALVLAFRTTGPLPQAILVLSGLLGGVYYPTNIIPSWIQQLSAAIPLTYGLRAIRQTLLDGRSLAYVSADVVTLLGFVILLLAVSLFAVAAALQYARRTGTLAQY